MNKPLYAMVLCVSKLLGSHRDFNLWPLLLFFSSVGSATYEYEKLLTRELGRSIALPSHPILVGLLSPLLWLILQVARTL